MKILGIDPGETTGWCLFDPDHPEESRCGEAEMEDIHTFLRSLCRLDADTVVVLESFRLYPSKREALTWNRFVPVEIIGMIKACCAADGIRLLEQPASVKRIVARPTLEAFGLWGKTRGKHHARDAAKHALYHYMRIAPEHVVSATLAQSQPPLTEVRGLPLADVRGS